MLKHWFQDMNGVRFDDFAIDHRLYYLNYPIMLLLLHFGLMHMSNGSAVPVRSFLLILWSGIIVGFICRFSTRRVSEREICRPLLSIVISLHWQDFLVMQGLFHYSLRDWEVARLDKCAVNVSVDDRLNFAVELLVHDLSYNRRLHFLPLQMALESAHPRFGSGLHRWPLLHGFQSVRWPHARRLSYLNELII